VSYYIKSKQGKAVGGSFGGGGRGKRPTEKILKIKVLNHIIKDT